MPGQVVPSQNVFDFVDDPCSLASCISAEYRQPPIVLVNFGSNLDLPQSLYRLTLQQTTAVDPQQLTECGGVATVCLLFFSLLRLDEDDFLTAVVVKHVNQPVAEPADFQNGNKRLTIAEPFAGKLPKELVDLLWAS